jgi:D-galactarolactone cycloisomerase
MSAVLAPVAAVAAEVKRVRITGIEAFPINIPVTKEESEAGYYHRFMVVDVATDAGVHGYSFAGPSAAELPQIRQLLVGKDLFAIEQHVMDGLDKWGGVEHALWDAVGRIAGQPVYRLLGGHSDRVKAYITCVWQGKADQSHVKYEEQAAMAVKLKAAGFKGMKIRVWRPNPLHDADCMGVIRAAVGSDFAVMFDRTAHAPVQAANQQVWDFETGLRAARALERQGAYWLEEPYARDDYNGPARLAAAVDIPVTGGEGYNGIDPFQKCLMQRTYDILQPDGRNAGGILNCRKVAIMAEGFHVPCILHGTMSLMLAGWLQATFAIGSEWQEVALVTPPLLPQQQWSPGLKVLRSKEMFRIENGYILAPEYPGIGLDVNPEALREYRRGG